MRTINHLNFKCEIPPKGLFSYNWGFENGPQGNNKVINVTFLFPPISAALNGQAVLTLEEQKTGMMNVRTPPPNPTPVFHLLVSCACPLLL